MKLQSVRLPPILVLTLLLALVHSYYATTLPYSGNTQTTRRFIDRLMQRNKENYVQDPPSDSDLNSNVYLPPNPLYKWYQKNVLPEDLSVEESKNYYLEQSGHKSQLPDLLFQEALLEELEDSIVHRRHVQDKHSKAEQRKRRKERRQRQKAERKAKRGQSSRKRAMRWDKLLSVKDLEIHHADGQKFVDCCPSEMIVTEKQVGKNRDNHAVETKPGIYYYERVCLPEFVSRECVFPAKTLRKNVDTRCGQQFSLIQTPVRAYQSTEAWHLDYIYIRAGCSCQVSTRTRKKRRRKRTILDIDEIPSLHQPILHWNQTQ